MLGSPEEMAVVWNLHFLRSSSRVVSAYDSPLATARGAARQHVRQATPSWSPDSLGFQHVSPACFAILVLSHGGPTFSLVSEYFSRFILQEVSNDSGGTLIALRVIRSPCARVFLSFFFCTRYRVP